MSFFGKKPGGTLVVGGLEISDDDDAAPQTVLRASRVFGEAKPSQARRRGPQSQTAKKEGGSGQQEAEGGGSPGLTKGRAKRRRVILEDDDDDDHHVEEVATEDQPQGSWRSSSRGDSVSHLHNEVVPETSEDTPAKGNAAEAGASSRGATEHFIAQPKAQRCEIKPGSFYATADQLSKPRTLIDLESKEDDKEKKERVVPYVDLEATKSNGVELLEDPVLHALKECEKIAAMLRKQLHTAEGATEGYSEVDAAAARLVTQAEITAVCASGDTATASTPLLKPYQLIGVNFLLLLRQQNIGGAICADEMGLGKTVQAITYLGILSQDTGQGPHLVVCPASLLENWSREFQLWCPALTLVVYHGPERAHVRHGIEMEGRNGGPPPFDVLLTTYSLFERSSTLAVEDRSFLRRFDWNCVVMDEAHLLKDHSSTRTKKLRKIASAAKCRLMLTGTPLQNDLQELWTLLNFLLPDIFQLKDLEAAGSRSDSPETQTGLIERLKTILAPFVLRRVKADVMQQLVAKQQKVETLAMHPAQAELYRSALDEYRAQAGPTGRVNKMPKRQVANIFTHLRKIANHPLLVRSKFSDSDVRSIAEKLHSWGVYNVEASVDRIYDELQGSSDYDLHQVCGQYPGLAEKTLSREEALASGKCEVLTQLLPALRAKSSRPLIFSQWTAMLDVLEWVLELLGFSYVRLDGSTQVSERQALVDRFNQDDNLFAFLLSTRAGGQGLNLTGADTVILHDVDFNPQVDRQAEDRCHRIGQTRPVTVYRLVSAQTVDESILEIANRKLSLDAAVLTDTGKSSGDSDSKSMGEILASLLAD